MGLTIIQGVSILMALLWTFFIYIGHILPIRRLKKNAPDGEILFLTKKKLILSLCCMEFFALLDILVTFLGEHPYFVTTVNLFIPLIFLPRWAVVRSKTELLVSRRVFRIASIEKIVFDESSGGQMTIHMKNEKSFKTDVSKEAKRFLNDLAVCIPAGYWSGEAQI